MDWFLYDNGLRRESANTYKHHHTKTLYIYYICGHIWDSLYIYYICVHGCLVSMGSVFHFCLHFHYD